MANILAIAGSPSHPSRSYAVLEYAQQILVQEELMMDLLSVREIDAEALLFAQFDHPDLTAAIAKIEQADALIISTPIYKAAYTGVLKAFLDLLPQNALLNKTILPIATGGTIAHLLALDYALKPVLSILGARHILAGLYIVDTQLEWLETGGVRFTETEIEQQFYTAVQTLGIVARSLATPIASVN